MLLRLLWQLRWLLLALLLAPYIPVLYGGIRASSVQTLSLVTSHLTTTAGLALLTVCLAGGIGVLLGLAIALLGRRSRRIATCALVAGVLLPLEFHAMVWLAWLGAGTPAGLRAGRGGIHAVIEQLLGNLGPPLSPADRDFLASLVAASLVHGLWGGGLVGIGTAAAALRVPQELLDAAAIETNSLWRTLRLVVVPMVWPATLASLLVAASFALTEIAVVDLLQLRTLADDVYIAFQLEADPGRAFAAALPLLSFALLLSILLLWLTRRGILDLVLAPERARLRGPTSRRVRSVAGIVVATAATAITAAPYAGILLRALTPADGRSSFSFGQRLVTLFDPVVATASVVQRELAVSALTGSVAATVATACAFWLVYGVRARAGLLLLAAIATVLAATPGPVLGIGVNSCAMWLGPLAYDSYVPLIWGMTLRCLPISLLVACAWRVRLAADLVDATELDCVNPFAVVSSVWWPLSRTHARISWTLGLLVTIGDVGVSAITAPPGVPPLPLRVFSLLHYGLDEYVAGIAFWLLLAVAAVGSLLLVLATRGEEAAGLPTTRRSR